MSQCISIARNNAFLNLSSASLPTPFCKMLKQFSSPFRYVVLCSTAFVELRNQQYETFRI
jgi:hypothetical protein